MSPEIATALIGGAVVLVGGFLERRHSTRMKRLEQQNSDQHARGYTLLESIDTRTQDTAKAVGDLQVWAAVHDATYPSGHTTVIIKEPAK